MEPSLRTEEEGEPQQARHCHLPGQLTALKQGLPPEQTQHGQGLRAAYSREEASSPKALMGQLVALWFLQGMTLESLKAAVGKHILIQAFHQPQKSPNILRDTSGFARSR